MIGFGQPMKAYRDGKAALEKLPHRDVPEEEFVRMAVGAGISLLEAQRTAFMCRCLGSRTQIGNEFLGVKTAE